MSTPPSQDARQRRIIQLAEEWGVILPPAVAPLTRPSHPPSYRTSDDDFHAEELLKRRQLSHGRTESTGNLRRAFTSKKKTWDQRHVFEVLDTHVANCGSPGVAESLINMLVASGGDLNGAQKVRGGLLGRRRSLDNLGERSKLLHQAIGNGQHDMIEILLPHADALALDTALPMAIRSQNVKVVEMLLRYGAGASQTADAQDAFRQACAMGGQGDLIGLLLRSEGRPPMTWLSQCMVDATRAGCLPTVLHLSRSTADGDFNQAEALKIAIGQGRHDIALAIIMGNKPPQRPGLDEAFAQLLEHPSISPREKIDVAELLLCAGTDGDGPAVALLNAANAEFIDMVHLLVTYGVSIEFQDAIALRNAISGKQVDVAHMLLNGNSSLSSTYASECVELIPKDMALEHRRLLLGQLLRRGASGEPLNNMLMEAAEAGDFESAKLLLTPQVPAARQNGGHDLKKGPRAMIYDRHAVASVDHNCGLPLQISVLRGDVPMTKLMLSSKPSSETLANVFPATKNLAPVDRYRIIECFLSSGLRGPCVHAGLQDAIDEKPPHRDENLIALFLKYNTDINSNDGSTLVAAIAQKDIKLLAALLRKNVTPQTAVAVLPKVISVSDPKARLEMASLILSAGASVEVAKVSSAMLKVLNTKPLDMKLLQILLQQGGADVNIERGIAMVSAIHSHDPSVLEILLKHGKASPATLSKALNELSQLPSSELKATKLNLLLQRTKQKQHLNDILVKEVHSLLQTEQANRLLSIAKVLLSSGADVNSHNAAALCHAVAAGDTQITDLLFLNKPNSASLAYALPHALSIADPMDRFTFAQRLLEAGAPSAEANRALGFAIATYSDDLPLLRTLAAKADTTDGEALVMAVKKERPDIVELVLRRKHPTAMLNNAFTQATKGSDKTARASICTQLLKAGASGSVVSAALLTAAADSDLVLGNILVGHGANVEDHDGQAVVEACRSGSVDVLNMLLSGNISPKKATLERGFQAATEVGDLEKRVAILAPLLSRGVEGDALDSQLVSATRFGTDGVELVRILLIAGANPDYNSGEAVWTATRSAFVASLGMLLGLVDIGGKQRKPSPATLTRAMKAAWKLSGESRLTVIDMLFEANLPLTEDIHIALNEAVNEELVDDKFIETLLQHGASPLTNCCKTMVDATRKVLATIMPSLLDREISVTDLNWIFKEGFTHENVNVWLSTAGFEVMRGFLAKGARGDGVSAALTTAIGMQSSGNTAMADRFVDLLLEYDVDVDHDNGKLLENAAAAANLVLIRRLLEKKPNVQSLSGAFYHIFDKTLSEDDALGLISLFTDYADGETRLDVMYAPPDSTPILFVVLSQYPRSSKILKALLDAGYYYDQMTACPVMQDVEDETVTLLAWALLQPQKKISSNIIQLLIESGAKVNFETRISRVTPLMLAIQARRPDIVKMLLLEGAEVDVADATGNTPLTMTTRIGGDLAITMMSNLLAAGASKNDGSLHNASRELNLPAVQVLVQYGHEPDFPSPLHGGRSALGEVCLHAADYEELSAVREKSMEKVMNFLIESGSDITLKSDGKSVLHLALESADPLATIRLLLKVGMWKHINKSFNHFTDGECTYSPTMYVSKMLPSTDLHDQLLTLLRANRATDVYFANSGPQPEGATGMPDDIQVQERERKARLERLATQKEEHQLSIARNRELAAVQAQIWSNQAELEDSRRKRQQEEELAAINQRARIEEDVFSAAMARKRNERSADLAHQAALSHASVSRAKAIGSAELEVEGRKKTMLIEWEKKLGTEKLDNERSMSAIRVAEREDVARMERQADERFKTRVAEQRRLVESQTTLASRLTSAGVNGQRQIGYITGELNS